MAFSTLARVTPVIVIWMAMWDAALAAGAVLPSPGKDLAVNVEVDSTGRLLLAVTRGAGEVIRASALGVTVDGNDLGQGVELGAAASREISETFPMRGVKSQGLNHCIAYELPVTHKASGTRWTLEVRVFDDGAACRYRVPGEGRRRIVGEATTWQLPADSAVWVQTNTANYEGPYHRHAAGQIPQRNEKGQAVHIGPPVTVELARGGFALLTEACLYRYSGMTLRPLGEGRLQAAFADDPQGWDTEGPVTSPWRVMVVAADLNALVNSDLIMSLGEKPDPSLFPEGANAPWIRPGRGLITWAVFFNDGAQWRRQKWFVDMCAAMNCEYLLVDGGWRTEKWGFLSGGADPWARLKELCDYAAARKVGIFVWNAYPEGRDDGPGLTRPEDREEFYRRCKEAGVKGVKIDFFDSESRKTIDVYEDILRQTARHQLMINFHGANKPTGESRTWPHEITREGLREQEYVLWEQLPLEHYGALPFTRMVAGHGDFLPGFVRPKFLKNTTAVFQMATAVIFTSPFICWPDHPEAYLESPFLSLVRAMPAVWEETRVLPGSTIGQRVAFARRSGTDWYVAILNCQGQSASHALDLSFLGEGEYQTTFYYDADAGLLSARIEGGGAVKRDGKLMVKLNPGGGFVARLSKPARYTE